MRNYNSVVRFTDAEYYRYNYSLTSALGLQYYGRKKYPDPPIINTDNTHMSHRNFQRSSTLEWYTVCGRCTVWLIEWHDY